MKLRLFETPKAVFLTLAVGVQWNKDGPPSHAVAGDSGGAQTKNLESKGENNEII
jgi:hypothetical protein